MILLKLKNLFNKLINFYKFVLPELSNFQKSLTSIGIFFMLFVYPCWVFGLITAFFFEATSHNKIGSAIFLTFSAIWSCISVMYIVTWLKAEWARYTANFKNGR